MSYYRINDALAQNLDVICEAAVAATLDVELQARHGVLGMNSPAVERSVTVLETLIPCIPDSDESARAMLTTRLRMIREYAERNDRRRRMRAS